MAPVPKKRHSKARTGKRRGNIKLVIPNLTKCPSCGELKKSHQTCKNCGFSGKKETKPEESKEVNSEPKKSEEKETKNK